MKVINYSEVSSIATMKDISIPKINFRDNDIAALLVKFEGNYIDIVNVLNNINNQGIEELLLPLYYKAKGKLLGIDCLSTAERVFLVSYLAIACNARIFLIQDLRGLERDTLKLFIKTFYKKDTNNCLYLVGQSYRDTARYNKFIKEVIEC